MTLNELYKFANKNEVKLGKEIVFIDSFGDEHKIVNIQCKNDKIILREVQ